MLFVISVNDNTRQTISLNIERGFNVSVNDVLKQAKDTSSMSRYYFKNNEDGPSYDERRVLIKENPLLNWRWKPYTGIRFGYIFIVWDLNGNMLSLNIDINKLREVEPNLNKIIVEDIVNGTSEEVDMYSYIMQLFSVGYVRCELVSFEDVFSQWKGVYVVLDKDDIIHVMNNKSIAWIKSLSLITDDLSTLNNELRVRLEDAQNKVSQSIKKLDKKALSKAIDELNDTRKYIDEVHNGKFSNGYWLPVKEEEKNEINI